MFVGTIIGFRHWRINSLWRTLDGPISNFGWPIAERAEAACLPMKLKSDAWKNPEPHETPDENCKCGFYGYHDLDEAIKHYGSHSWSIFGSAVYWGRIEVHTVGFKAQYARAVALTDPPVENLVRDLTWSTILEQTSERYKLPVLPLDLLEEYTSTFGEKLGAAFIE